MKERKTVSIKCSEADRLRLCTYLRAIKDRYGYSHQQIADKMGISISAFSQYTRGIVPLNISFILQFSMIYKIDPVLIMPTLLPYIRGKYEFT